MLHRAFLWSRDNRIPAAVDDSKYKRLKALVEASITPRETTDKNGTCNREECLCKSCFVKSLMPKKN